MSLTAERISEIKQEAAISLRGRNRLLWAVGIMELIEEIDEKNNEIEQLRVQLAGCLTAADGATHEPATQGMYGWSPAYQAVLDLRIKFDAIVEALQGYCK